MTAVVTREIHLALPPHDGDIYRRHQLVWRAMHDHVRSGQDFIFAPLGDRLVLVRSSRLARGEKTAVAGGRLICTLVASARVPTETTPISDEALPAYVNQLMEANGFELLSCEAQPFFIARGEKQDAASGQLLRIQLPVREVEMDVRIKHGAKAELAWRNGVGRGKRFGYGMLRHAR